MDGEDEKTASPGTHQEQGVTVHQTGNLGIPVRQQSLGASIAAQWEGIHILKWRQFTVKWEKFKSKKDSKNGWPGGSLSVLITLHHVQLVLTSFMDQVLLSPYHANEYRPSHDM